MGSTDCVILIVVADTADMRVMDEAWLDHVVGRVFGRSPCVLEGEDGRRVAVVPLEIEDRRVLAESSSGQVVVGMPLLARLQDVERRRWVLPISVVAVSPFTWSADRLVLRAGVARLDSDTRQAGRGLVALRASLAAVSGDRTRVGADVGGHLAVWRRAGHPR